MATQKKRTAATKPPGTKKPKTTQKAKKKPDNKHTEMLAGGVIVIGLGYLAFKAFQASRSDDVTSVTQGFPLKMGSRGELVKFLQKALMSKGGLTKSYVFTTGGADGILGEGTARAINEQSHSLPLSEASYKKIVGDFALPANTSGVGSDYRTYLVVTSWTGAPLWREVSANGREGMYKITSLANKTFVGTPTGVERGDYRQAIIQVDNKSYRFWIHKKAVTEMESRVYIAYMQSTGKEKAQDELSAIVRAFS
jgi:hypothetical protein